MWRKIWWVQIAPNQKKILILIIYLIVIISKNKCDKLKNRSFRDKLRGKISLFTKNKKL